MSQLESRMLNLELCVERLEIEEEELSLEPAREESADLWGMRAGAGTGQK